MRKIVTLAVGIALATSTSPAAQAHDGRNGAFALGAITGLLLAAPRPAYVYSPPPAPIYVPAPPAVVYAPPAPVYYAPPPPVYYAPPAAAVYPAPVYGYR